MARFHLLQTQGSLPLDQKGRISIYTIFFPYCHLLLDWGYNTDTWSRLVKTGGWRKEAQLGFFSSSCSLPLQVFIPNTIFYWKSTDGDFEHSNNNDHWRFYWKSSDIDFKYKSSGGTIEEDQKTSDDLDRILEELRAENEVLWAKAAKWEIFLPVCIYVCF